MENLNADLIPKRVELKHHDKPVQSLNIGSLNDYVRSIEGKLPDDETEQCVLVGHSLGGMAISAAAADPALKGRIKRLVYVAAVMPMAGQTAGALLPVLSKGQGAVLAEFHKLGLVGAIRAMTTLASRDMGKSW